MFVVESIVLPAPSSTATAVQPEGCSSTACPVHPLMVQALVSAPAGPCTR